MSRLLMVRHGDTELNSAERYWGDTDVALSEAGFEQAEKMRQRLAAEKLDAIYSSNLKRASETAKIVAAEHQLEVITCAELREVNFGKLEGMTFAEVRQLYPEVTDLWMKRSLNLRFPDGESLGEFSVRVSKFLERLENHTPEETILIVAHSGVIRTLICQLMGIDLQHRWQIRLDLGSLSILETYPQRAILNRLNDVCHLM